MASKNQQYAEQYAEYAMEQMRLYGIPASITLAQGILESANGQSQLAKNENNHFGIKATPSWVANGGKFGLYTDDRPDEKFCSYDTVGDSYAHHSRFLKENSRYAACFRLEADDYKGWAEELDRAGYATSGSYAPALVSIIERNGLQRYDRMVMEEMKAQGLRTGESQRNGQLSDGMPVTDYSFPLKRNEFLFVTSPFGMRQDPMDSSKQQMHKGIDIRCEHEALFATEMNGKVIAANDNANTVGGKSVTIEYGREDGSKVQVSYLHLSSLSVKAGDTVNAGEQIGVSGNTGIRTTGSHLHLEVRQTTPDGSTRNVDPAAYLADIAEKGNIRLTAMYNGQDLLAKYREVDSGKPSIDTSLSAEEWMKKLLSSEDSGIGLVSSGQDPVVEMAMMLFTSLMALAVQIDNKSEEEKTATVTESVLKREVDLTSLVPAFQKCSLVIGENGTPILQINDGTNRYGHLMTVVEMNRLNLVLSDNALDKETKHSRVAAIINGIALHEQMSREYQQGISQQSQSETLAIK